MSRSIQVMNYMLLLGSSVSSIVSKIPPEYWTSRKDCPNSQKLKWGPSRSIPSSLRVASYTASRCRTVTCTATDGSGKEIIHSYKPNRCFIYPITYRENPSRKSHNSDQNKKQKLELTLSWTHFSNLKLIDVCSVMSVKCGRFWRND